MYKTKFLKITRITNDVALINMVNSETHRCYIITNCGRVLNHLGKELSKIDNGSGYKYVTLSNKGYSKREYIHRLVAKAFINNPKPEEFLVVNHKDFNKSNNNYSNLEWSTQKENIQYSNNAGRKRKPQNKIIQLSLDNEEIKVWGSAYEAAEYLKCTPELLWMAASEKNKLKTAKGYKWKNVNN